MNNTKEIRIITEANGHDLQYVQSVIPVFERKHPDVKVTLIQAEDSYGVMDRFNSDGADLLHIREGEYINRLRKGIVRDLMPFVSSDPTINLSDFYKGTLEHPSWKGQLAAIPVADVAVPLIFYNKKLFSEAGVPFPAENWTVEQFLDAASRLTKPGATPETSQYGLYVHLDVEFLEPFLMRRGGQYVAEDGSTAQGYTNSEIAITTYQWIVDLFRKHRVAPMPGTQFERMFRTNRVAMIYEFSWYLEGVSNDPELSENYGVAGLPHFEGGVDTNMMYSTGYGIPAISEQPELAWELLRELAIPSTDATRKAYWGVPITKSLAKDQGRSENPWWGPALANMERIQKSAYQYSAIWNRSRQKMNEDIEKMMIDGTDVKETLSRWAKILD